MLLDLIFGRFRAYRRLIGGPWARATPTNPTGRGPWLRFTPVSIRSLELMLAAGIIRFEYHEDGFRGWLRMKRVTRL